MTGVIVAAAASGVFLFTPSRTTPSTPPPGTAVAQVASATPPGSAAPGGAPYVAPAAAPVAAPPATRITAPAAAVAAATPTTAPAMRASAATMPVSTAARTASPASAPASMPAAPAPVSAEAAFGQAKQRLAAGDPAGARRVLNAALVAGLYSEAEAADAKRQMAEINKLLVFSPRRMSGDEWMVAHRVEPGEMLAKIAAANNINYQFVQRINPGLEDPRKLRAGATIKLLKGPFHAVVTKHAFTMDLYLGAPGGEGSMYVTTFRVGLGTDDSTPTGKWLVEPGHKVTNPKYIDPRSGRIYEPDDPTNPLGEYWIGLLGTEGNSVGQPSYGVHATIEPDTIGKQASLGCIRLLNDDVALVFDMLSEGKSMVIVLP